MLSNRTRPPIINKLPDPLASPKCSLELRILSPRCLENPNPVAGVGLAIVAALEKSSPSPGTSVKSIPIPIYGGGSKCKYTDQDEDDGGCGDMSFKNSSGVFSYESQPKMNPNMVLPPLDFLNSCGLCRKKLHGVDIYMYRGEKAFCSKECRCRQMMIDEHREKCGSELSKSSVDMSTSPYSRDNIFFTGIIVA